MFTLILDTSTEKGIVIIAQGSKVVFEMPLVLKAIKGSTLLLSTIQKGFDALKISSLDVKMVAVGAGPGSFTGIRSAVSLGKGLALARNIPILGFSSLMGFISDKEGKFASLIPTRIGGSYLLIRSCYNGNIIELSEPEFILNENLKEKVADCVTIVSSLEVFPSAPYLSQMVEKKFLEKKYCCEGNIEICYLSPSHSSI